MDNTSFHRLEFSAVLEHLAAEAQSPGAKRLALETQPWTDLEILRRHAGVVEEILGLLDGGGNLAIGAFDDCEDLLRHLEKPDGVLGPADWQTLLSFIDTGIALRRQGHEARERMILYWNHARTIDPLKNLSIKITSVFESDGSVRDSASDRLRSLRGNIKRFEREIERVFERILMKHRDSDVLREAYWTERGGRRVVPVQIGSRSKLPGIVHDTSSTGETLFVEPLEAIEPTNRLSEERNQEREEIARILSRLAAIARTDLPSLLLNRQTLLQIDLWHARARLAYRHGLHRIKVVPDRPVELIEVHHPLLYFTDPEASVPLSMRLEPENRALIITGPNTGGKTTSLKTIALTVLMVQSAIPVPAAVDSRLPLFQQVLAEIGDEQSVTAGLSTFSAHIRRISWILENCGRDALVLLDELGKATDPLQAGALGRAILQALIERQTLTLVTTHLATLKDWAHENPAGRNASYRLDPNTHRPLYEMHLDTPGISEAFTIARAEGLPQEIVDAAIEHMPKEERDLSEMLDTLYAKEENLNREIKRSEAARQKAEQERSRLKKERSELSRTKLAADETLEVKYKELLDKARQDLEKRIANLPSRQALSKARDEVARDQRDAEARIEALERREKQILKSAAPPGQEPPPPYKPAEGDWVTIGKGEQVAQIEKINTSRREAEVVVGNMRIKAKLKALMPAAAPEDQSDNRYSGFRYLSGGTSAQSVSSEIDLVGQRVEGALENLDKYLDQAIMAHLTKIRIVHGHGTGALRSAVHEFLSHHPHARSHRLANLREGGPAVTEVKLK